VVRLQDNGANDIIEAWADTSAGDDGTDCFGRVEKYFTAWSRNLEARQSGSAIETGLNAFEGMVNKHPVIIVVECVCGPTFTEKRLERRLNVSLAEGPDEQLFWVWFQHNKGYSKIYDSSKAWVC
jgi:hypothetical protein